MYQVIFVDGTKFDGGNYQETKWKAIPNKPIKQINFVMPDGNIFILHDYDEYNHFVEVTTDIYAGKRNSQNLGKVILRYQYLLGRKGDKVVSYRISLYQSETSKYKSGDITRRVYEFGKEDNGKPSLGWKRGI